MRVRSNKKFRTNEKVNVLRESQTLVGLLQKKKKNGLCEPQTMALLLSGKFLEM